MSFGHDIETSWLALECAFALGDEAVTSRVRSWAYAMGLAGNEGLLPDGSIDKANPKAGFWKCPYHNTRMCLQVLSLL